MLGQIGQALSEIFSFRQKYLNALYYRIIAAGHPCKNNNIYFCPQRPVYPHLVWSLEQSKTRISRPPQHLNTPVLVHIMPGNDTFVMGDMASIVAQLLYKFKDRLM